MKRKMLRNCLQACYSVTHIDAAMSAAKLDAQLRPQQLSFDDYVLLYESLHPHMQWEGNIACAERQEPSSK